MQSGSATVAAIAAGTESRLATAGSDAAATLVTFATDADGAAGAVTLDGGIVVLAWEPVQPNGPLPDLLVELGDVFAKRPAAVLVRPVRQVNPPRPLVDRAERSNICLLWSFHSATAEHLRADVDRILAAAPAPPERAGLVLPAELALVADDLGRLLDALGTTLDGTVVLGEGFAPGGEPVARIAVPLGAGPATFLDVYRDRPLGSDDTALLEAVLPILRLHLRVGGTENVDAAAEVARSLKSVLGEDLAQREATLRKSRRLSMFPRHTLVCLVIEPFGVSITMAGLQRLRMALAPVARRADRDAVSVVHEGAVIMLVDVTVDLDSLSRALYRAVQVPLAIGAGNEVDDPRSYPSSFRQAQRAVAVGRRVGGINRVTRYRELGVLGLLYQLPEHARRDFVAETLASVAEDTPDGLGQRRILRTLRATDCNITESARKLFIHQNTLRARIARIEAVTGPFLNDPARRLTIFTALAMYSLDSNIEDD